MNLAEEIFSRANPAAVAVIESRATYTYGELDRLSAKVAQTLRKQGVAGHRIGLRCKDGMAYIALALGILRSGACFVPLAPELTGTEQEALMDAMALHRIVTGGEIASDDLSFSVEDGQSGKTLAAEESLLRLNPAFIRFSSGTTGKSKGVVISHESLRERILAANAGLRIGAEDRVLWVLSMSHHFAVSIMLYLWHGAAIVLPATHLAGDILAAAQKHAVTVLYAAPCHYLQLASGEATTPWPSLRLAVSTTAGLPPEHAKAFAAKFGVHPAQALGIIEVGLPLLNLPDPEKRPESVGCAQSAFQVQIRDHDGNVMGPGVPGEMHLRGPGMFDAYAAPWRARSEVLKADAWFCTGDIAQMDAEGYVFLLGRSSAVINVGGMKFFPDEVEALLCTHPGVKEARVLGVAHPSFGVVPIAEIVRSGQCEVSAGELGAFCRKRLARYKLPVEYRFCDCLPKTASGKLKRT